LKSLKSSPTNQDRRENAINNKFTEKDLANQIQDVNLRSNNNNEKGNKNFDKQETNMSFGGFNRANKDINENQDSLRTLNNDSKYYKSIFYFIIKKIDNFFIILSMFSDY